MKAQLYILILVVFASLQGLFAQNKLTNAVNALQNSEFVKAQELIDAAIQDTIFKDDLRTWYYRGNIYKELFKQIELEDNRNEYRSIAVSSFKTSYDMDRDSEVAMSNQSNLNYLASTMFNDAVNQLDNKDYTLAIENYEGYKSIIKFIEPGRDFIKEDIQFKLALASSYTMLSEIDTINLGIYLEKSKLLYEEVLLLDSNNISGNYNMGILYYNQGADIVNNMDYSLDLKELTMIQEDVHVLFSKSLPFMLKAYKMNPNKMETLIGLKGIYYSMNNMEKSDLFKHKIEELENKEIKN